MDRKIWLYYHNSTETNQSLKYWLKILKQSRKNKLFKSTNMNITFSNLRISLKVIALMKESRPCSMKLIIPVKTAIALHSLKPSTPTQWVCLMDMEALSSQNIPSKKSIILLIVSWKTTQLLIKVEKLEVCSNKRSNGAIPN